MPQNNFKEEITKLIKLQEIDTELYKLNKEKNEKPKILEALQNEFEQKNKILQEFEQRSKSLLLKRKDKDGELAVKEGSINKLQTQLYSLKTNKEYSAKLSEIGGAKMDKSLLEEEIIKILEEQEDLQKELGQKQIEMKKEEEEFQKEKQKILNLIKEAEAKIKELELKRVSAEEGINKNMLSQYNKVLKGKDGLALVKVENNSCQGCHMNTPHQVINEIQMYSKLVFCEMCSRILYVEDGPNV